MASKVEVVIDQESLDKAMEKVKALSSMLEILNAQMRITLKAFERLGEAAKSWTEENEKIKTC